MTMKPMYMTRFRCKQMYSWNPNVRGKGCPYCGPLGMLGTDNIPWRKIKEILCGRKNRCHSASIVAIIQLEHFLIC